MEEEYRQRHLKELFLRINDLIGMSNNNNIMDNYHAERAYLLQHFQEYRIIQSKVVFLHGLPTSLSLPQTLNHQIQQFGKLSKVNVQAVGKDFHSAFLEFESELDAALLIVMLDQSPLRNRTLRTFYGSTKFCPHYLKGHVCRVRDCNYAHYYHPYLTHLKDQAKDIAHHEIARMHILQNFHVLPTTVQKLLSRVAQPKHMLPLNNDKLIVFLNAQGFMSAPVQSKELQAPDELQTEGEDAYEMQDWQILEKQICETAEQQINEQEIKCVRSKIQQFLDGAQRFLSQLIFHSSAFVY